ncbi:MAG TPA: PhnD/SsuA/transferrin family substrate-binding protein [Xanthomonadaceae bacterium]|nr:PhnD/SsuA/transferrin family substrate-binding protein [Xanthomonadaceae bacterium]
MKPNAGLLSVVLALLPACAAAETYRFAVEPSYPPERAEEVYQPLLEYLAMATGHQFELVTSRNYHFYWRDLRRAEPVDFVFEEAHFTDYRANRAQFVPLARMVEPSVYVLLATPDHADRGLDGLVGYRVISMPSPSLGFALVSQMYRNPLSQPELKSEATSWREGVEIVFAGEGEGAVVPRRIAEQYPNLVEVQASQELPGAAVSAAPGVPEDVRTAVREALLKLHEDSAMYEVLVEIGASQFEPAERADYVGSENVLRGFFGYQPLAD